MGTDLHSQLVPGTVVEVSNLFTGRWTTGFRVVCRDAEGYWIERLSDGSTVPTAFPATRLRPALVVGDAAAMSAPTPARATATAAV